MSLDTDDVSSLVFSRSPITHDVVQSGRYVSQLPSFPELDIVFSEPHNAKFIATPISGMSPLSVQFTNKSINAAKYLWNFGD